MAYPNGLTVSAVKILLHYYALAGNPEELIENGAGWRSDIDMLLAFDLLDRHEDRSTDSAYRVTVRGDVYCKALMNLPLPVHAWRMP